MATSGCGRLGTHSSTSCPLHPISLFSPPPLFSVGSHLKRVVRERRFVLLKVSCVSEGSKGITESESETKPSSPSALEQPSSPAVSYHDQASVSSYNWCAALGGIGFLETSYLTYLKLTGSDAFCPSGATSCTTILTSDYSSVFGIPLPLFGMLSYALVSIIGLKLGTRRTADVDNTSNEMILIGLTTSMTVASAYFLYILSNKFIGETCLYCLASATLSFSLFFITLKNFGPEKIKKIFGSQLLLAGLVVLALSTSYNAAQPISSSLAEEELPYFEIEITKESSSYALSLARHLQSIGAKLYGAFWCSHCSDQKQMFGREAAKMLNYVECFPDGVMRGARMSKACLDIDLRGFPTWEINGQVLSGEKQLSELAALSGFEDSRQ